MLFVKLSDLKLGTEYQFIIEMFVILNDFPVFSHNKQTKTQGGGWGWGWGGETALLSRTPNIRKLMTGLLITDLVFRIAFKKLRNR